MAAKGAETKISRVQSPSSINTYKQCPRKYYYKYIEELASLPNVHQIRGKCVHSVLEEFFEIDPSNIKTNHEFVLKTVIHDLFNKHWKNALQQMEDAGLDRNQLMLYYHESKAMAQAFLENFMFKLENEMQERSFKDAFIRLTPITEKEYVSERYGVRGFMDAIHHLDEKIKILDYKTSKKDEMSEEIKLQMAIYSLLYFEKHGVLPDKVGVHFLKFGEKTMNVDKELLRFAKQEITLVHQKTCSTDICDYPRKVSGLCKWYTGKCDYFDICKD